MRETAAIDHFQTQQSTASHLLSGAGGGPSLSVVHFKYLSGGVDRIARGDPAVLAERWRVATPERRDGGHCQQDRQLEEGVRLREPVAKWQNHGNAVTRIGRTARTSPKHRRAIAPLENARRAREEMRGTRQVASGGGLVPTEFTGGKTSLVVTSFALEYRSKMSVMINP